jgi:mannose-6-phosphate isomerase-like protein (cupin superfamily)
MKTVKYSKSDAKITDQVTKIVHAYPSPTRMMSVAYMEIKGRHPQGNKFSLDHDCAFMIYVTKGEGKVYLDKEIVKVTVGDVVYVAIGTPFACEGRMEYVIVDVPGFYPEQIEETD